jgi:chlorite dismutase
MVKEKYMTLLFCKIKDSYYALEQKTRTEITHAHVSDLSRFAKNISHLVTTGFNGEYDQVALIESDDLKTIYDAVEAFKLGKKGQHIEVVNAVFGIKVENKSDFEMIGLR